MVLALVHAPGIALAPDPLRPAPLHGRLDRLRHRRPDLPRSLARLPAVVVERRTLREGAGQFFGIFQPVYVHTFEYVVIASASVSFWGTRSRTTSPATAGGARRCSSSLLIAPFCISYLMRMLAWINLLDNDGYVNRILDVPPRLTATDRLARGATAHRDHGPGVRVHPVHDPAPVRRSWTGSTPACWRRDATWGQPASHVLPRDPAAVRAGHPGRVVIIVALPMFGDYYTHNLLSARRGPRCSAT